MSIHDPRAGDGGDGGVGGEMDERASAAQSIFRRRRPPTPSQWPPWDDRLDGSLRLTVLCLWAYTTDL